MKFSKFYEKSAYIIFFPLFFCKLRQMIFLGKILFFKVFGSKGPEMGPKWSFQVLWKIDAWDFFYFCMKLQQHKVLKLISIIFWEKSCFEVFGPKRPMNGPRMGLKRVFFLVLWKIDIQSFFEFLHKVTVVYKLKVNQK